MQFTDEGLVYPHHREHAAESALAHYLAEARQLLAQRRDLTEEDMRWDPDLIDVPDTQVRWFALARACLEPVP